MHMAGATRAARKSVLSTSSALVSSLNLYVKVG